MAHLEKHRSKSEVADVEKDEHVLQPKNFGENFPSGYFPATAEEKALNRALNRKLDLFLLPFMSLLYLFNGLDRGNVGNAETQGKFSGRKQILCRYVTTMQKLVNLWHLQASPRILVHSPMIST